MSPSPCTCPPSFKALLLHHDLDPCGECERLVQDCARESDRHVATRLLDGLRKEREVELLQVAVAGITARLRKEILAGYPEGFASRNLTTLVKRMRREIDDAEGAERQFAYALDNALEQLAANLEERVRRCQVDYRGIGDLENLCRLNLWGKHGEKFLVRELRRILLIPVRGTPGLRVQQLDEDRIGAAPPRPAADRKRPGAGSGRSISRDELLESLAVFAGLEKPHADAFLEFIAFSAEGNRDFDGLNAASVIADPAERQRLAGKVAVWRSSSPSTPAERARAAVAAMPEAIPCFRGFTAWLAIGTKPGGDKRQTANPASLKKRRLAEAWCEQLGGLAFRDPIYTILKTRG